MFLANGEAGNRVVTTMKTFTTLFIFATAFFVKSTAQAADTPRVSPSPIELVMNCGNVFSNKFDNDTFIERVEFGKARNLSTNIALEVTFRNVGEKSVWPDIYIPNLSIVWDGTEYKQTLRPTGWSEDALSPHDTRGNYYFLSDFNIPPEARASGRHTVAVRDAFSETNTFTFSNGFSSQVRSESNRLIFAESSTLTVFLDNAQ
jgi:hypothetical protein